MTGFKIRKNPEKLERIRVNQRMQWNSEEYNKIWKNPKEYEKVWKNMEKFERTK